MAAVGAHDTLEDIPHRSVLPGGPDWLVPFRWVVFTSILLQGLSGGKETIRERERERDRKSKERDIDFDVFFTVQSFLKTYSLDGLYFVFLFFIVCRTRLRAWERQRGCLRERTKKKREIKFNNPFTPQAFNHSLGRFYVCFFFLFILFARHHQEL